MATRHERATGTTSSGPRSSSSDVAPYAEGSCLIATGETRVLCTASVDGGRPGVARASGAGVGHRRVRHAPPRHPHAGRARERDGVKGRTQEIQRLIGRSLRSVTDLRVAGTPHGDRGLRCPAGRRRHPHRVHHRGVRGPDARRGVAAGRGTVERNPVRQRVAAVSVGLVDGEPQPRPRLPRGLHRPGGHERGGDRGAGAGGGAGHRRRRSLPTPRPGSAARPGPGRASRSCWPHRRGRSRR